MMIKKKKLGVFKVNITCPTDPKDLLHPIIPYKLNNSTIYGTGNWTAWYNSSELNNALKFGYKYTILAGYLFDSEYIFDDYITDINHMKENSEKDKWVLKE